jgi:predicted Fe-S protein YdhL (DUF1289 family)
MPISATDIKIPCNRVGGVAPTLRLRVGCGRSLDEIAPRIELSDPERSPIMAPLPARLAATNGASAAPA